MTAALPHWESLASNGIFLAPVCSVLAIASAIASIVAKSRPAAAVGLGSAGLSLVLGTLGIAGGRVILSRFGTESTLSTWTQLVASSPEVLIALAANVLAAAVSMTTLVAHRTQSQSSQGERF